MKPLGWMTTSTPSSSAFFQNGAKAGSDSSLPLTLVRTCTPLKPSLVTQRSSSLAASLPSGIGTVPKPLRRSGLRATNSAMPSLTMLRRLHGDVERHRVVALRRRRLDHLHVEAHGVEIGEPLVEAARAARCRPPASG